MKTIQLLIRTCVAALGAAIAPLGAEGALAGYIVDVLEPLAMFALECLSTTQHYLRRDAI